MSILKSRVVRMSVLGLVLCCSCVTARLTIGSELKGNLATDQSGQRFSVDKILGSPTLLLYVRDNHERSEHMIQDCFEWLDVVDQLKIVVVSDSQIVSDDIILPGISYLVDEDRILYGDWEIRVLPTAVFVDENAKILAIHKGYGMHTGDDLLAELQKYAGIILPEATEPDEFADIEDAAKRHFRLGKRLWDEGFPDRACEEWKLSSENDPAYTQPLIYLGSYYLSEGDAQTAIDYADRALALSVTSETLLLSAKCRLFLGDLESAETQFENALDLDPMSPSAKLGLAEVYLLTSDVELAGDLVNEVLILNKHYPQAYYMMGKVEEARGDLASAIEYYRKAIELYAHDHLD